jgi:NAD(P)-dependent dehydrogenase (short-subunit alcohol dehydrogenase family)
MAPSLHGKVVLITGASSGVGYAAAEEFARAGCDVAVLARSEDGLQRAAAAAAAHGVRTLVLPCDVTDTEKLQESVDRVEAELGALDILVPNHAMTIYGPFREVSKEEFDRVVHITFLGVVDIVRASLPALERSGGKIVATGSLNAKLPLPAWSSYSASKWAVRGFLHTLRLELEAQRSPVTVSMVHPGAIDTPVWEATPTATGTMPRKPPEGYSAKTVAKALVGMARNPRPEFTLGAEAKAIEWLWMDARPLGDIMWRAVYHYYQSGTQPALSDVNALWQAVGKGLADGNIIGRPSLTLPVRLATLPLRLSVKPLKALRPA